MKSKSSNIKNFLLNLFTYQEKKEYDFTLNETPTEGSDFPTVEPSSQTTDVNIFNSIDKNLNFVKDKYSKQINSDIEIREFNITAKNKLYKAFMLYIDGMVDSDLINNYILKPLMLRNSANSFNTDIDSVSTTKDSNKISIKKSDSSNIQKYISNCLLPQNSVKNISNFKKLFSDVNSGNCALFIDTLDIAFDIEVKGFKQRSIESPQNEVVIRGPQYGFNEVIRTNTALLRRVVNTEDLIIENISIGTISNTSCAVCYIKSIANEELVNEVKKRLNNIDIDYLISSGQLEQLISDNIKSSLPQTIATERPDRAAHYLFEGRVVIIVNGTPYVLVVPGTFMDYLVSPEDKNLKFQYANLLKLLRLFALIISVFVPGFYIAIANFHQELIPTELLFAIVASRVSVPFPIILEILIMEFSFELIREAGVRVPSPAGQTIGIVGALVLGQAAVDANIVSPILIIIVAITGIASFAIPDYSLAFHFRIAKFVYIALGYFAGFFGIALGLFVHLLILTNIKSFGTPYMQPYIPMTNASKSSAYFLPPIWKREYRSDFLNTKRPKKQKNISMKWRH